MGEVFSFLAMIDFNSTTPAPVTLAAPKKKGRPRKTYRTSWDTHVDGLLHRTDGRWQIVATGQIFTERDERKAVARAQSIINKLNGTTIEITTPISALRGKTKAKPRDAAEFVDRVLECTKLAREHGTPVFTSQNPEEWLVANNVSGAVIWPWLREMLIKRPEFVAEMVGIPEVARLADLPKRGPSPSLDRVGDEYREHAKVTERGLRLLDVGLGFANASRGGVVEGLQPSLVCIEFCCFGRRQPAGAPAPQAGLGLGELLVDLHVAGGPFVELRRFAGPDELVDRAAPKVHHLLVVRMRGRIGLERADGSQGHLVVANVDGGGIDQEGAVRRGEAVDRLEARRCVLPLAQPHIRVAGGMDEFDQAGVGWFHPATTQFSLCIRGDRERSLEVLLHERVDQRGLHVNEDRRVRRGRRDGGLTCRGGGRSRRKGTKHSDT